MKHALEIPEFVLHPCWLKGTNIKRIMSHKASEIQEKKVALMQGFKSNEVNRLRRRSSPGIGSKIQLDRRNLDKHWEL